MLLQQILTNRLLQAVIDSKKIISVMGFIVNVVFLKKKKRKKAIHKKKFTTFFRIVELANFY